VLCFILKAFKAIIIKDQKVSQQILDLNNLIHHKDDRVNIISKICELEQKGQFNLIDNDGSSFSNGNENDKENVLKEKNENNVSKVLNTAKSLRTNTMTHLADKKMYKQLIFNWTCVTPNKDTEIFNHTFKKLVPDNEVSWAQVR